jgi:hypothetical protein
MNMEICKRRRKKIMNKVWHGIVLYSDAHKLQQICGTLTIASVFQQVRQFQSKYTLLFDGKIWK